MMCLKPGPQLRGDIRGQCLTKYFCDPQIVFGPEKIVLYMQQKRISPY